MKGPLFASLAASASSLSNNNVISSSSLPILRGVVFDMDGTLTKPNLDFGEMYRRCGVDRSLDILEEIANMAPQEQLVANAIIEEMEEEGRQTLELMPGALHAVNWLAEHHIPMALVTRNTRKSAAVLTKRLLTPPNNTRIAGGTAGTSCYFSTIIPRDDGYPPKPHPKALEVVAGQWDISLPSDNILMVGDSLSNDIVFGKNAGVRTALLDTSRRYQRNVVDDKKESIAPDIVLNDLGLLPSSLSPLFSIKKPMRSH